MEGRVMGISVFLESVIGLFFIFLVVSLLVTAANEFIAATFALRAKNLRKGIAVMLGGNEEATTRFFNHPLVLLASKTTKRGPSYVPKENFAEILCDYVSSAGGYAVLGAHYMKDFDLLARIDEAPLPDEVKKLVASFAAASKNDLDAFKAKLGSWFDNAMERVSGWYNRTLRMISLLLGLAIALVANIDAIVVASVLAQNDAARASVVGQAIEYIKAREGAAEEGAGAEIAKELDKLLTKDMGDLKTSGLIGWGENSRVWAIEKNAEENSAPLILNILLKAFGLLGTALAASLGAPFWFDLLGRLVNMRSSLRDESKTTAASQPPVPAEKDSSR
jgi:hypothetical protein